MEAHVLPLGFTAICSVEKWCPDCTVLDLGRACSLTILSVPSLSSLCILTNFCLHICPRVSLPFLYCSFPQIVLLCVTCDILPFVSTLLSFHFCHSVPKAWLCSPPHLVFPKSFCSAWLSFSVPSFASKSGHFLLCFLQISTGKWDHRDFFLWFLFWYLIL